jgi:ubiquinone/menaquinone biosynthesis C-methylase UbiE
VKQWYDARFFVDLRGSTAKEESRDDNIRRKSDPKMVFEVGDITDGLHYPNESFDLIICKKTLDFILCGAGSAANAKSMMNECYRLLNKDYGVMMILSTAIADDRAFCHLE